VMEMTTCGASWGRAASRALRLYTKISIVLDTIPLVRSLGDFGETSATS
jgi:hypothetical protein